MTRAITDKGVTMPFPGRDDDGFGWSNSFSGHHQPRIMPPDPPKPSLFEGFRPRYLVLGVLGLVFVVVSIFLVVLGINFLAELGSHETFRVIDWFRGAGFRSQWEFTNFMKLFLLAVFVGWTINRFRNRR